MKHIITILLLATAVISLGCTEKSEYQKLVEKELDKETRKDSLFLGYEFGMKRKEFYDYSWDLNKQELVKQGPRNMTIEYEMNDKLPHPATMNFYPDFYKGKIFRMRTTFVYKGWAPWNKNLGADSLMYDVKSMMNKWYGKGFIKIKDPQRGMVFKKIDSNREIVISQATDNRTVNVVFTDLSIRKEAPDSLFNNNF